MLVCQCNGITLAEVETAIEELLHIEAYQLIVPMQVYRRLNQRGRCCGCFPNIVETIIRVTANFHKQRETPSAEIIDLVARLKLLNATEEPAFDALPQVETA